MKKNIKKLFKEDFRKSYSCNYNKEEVMQNFIVKEKNKGLIHTTKRKLILQYCLIGLLGIVIGISIYHFKDSFNGNDDVITEEFREYLKEQGHRSYIDKEKYLITIEDEVYIFIYEFNHLFDEQKNNYYYLVKSSKEKQFKLYIDNKAYILENNSFGLLTSIHESNEVKSIEFSIEVDGQIKNYVLS